MTDKNAQITFRLTQTERRKAERAAKADNRSLSSWLRALIIRNTSTPNA